MFDANTVRQWLAQAAQLKSIRDLEKATRGGLIEQFFGAVPKRGTSHALAAEDLRLTLVQEYSYKVKRDDLLQVQDALTDADKEAIKWVPEVKPGVFRKLPEDSVLRKIVLVKPAGGSLSALDMGVK